MLSSILILLLATVASAAPILPAADPFYTPTGTRWQSAAPGAIINSRSVSIDNYGVLPVPVTGYQLLFRSNDIQGNPIAAVTTIMVPPNASNNKLLAYSVPEDSLNTMCAPSYLMQSGLGSSDTMYLFDQVVIEGALVQGWIVTTSDHEGPLSAYAAGRQEGRIVLDSIRATLNFGSTIGLLPTAKVAATGYSGGAIATGWAAALQKTYAPELGSQIVGYATGGTPSNLTATGLYLNGGPHSGFLFGSLIGIAQVYPDFAASVNALATPSTKRFIADLKQNECDGDSKIDNVDLFATTNYFTTGPATLNNPVWQATLNDGLLGAGGSQFAPGAPYFLYHSVQDDYIPYATAPVLAAAWCAAGSIIDFQTNPVPGVGHVVSPHPTSPLLASLRRFHLPVSRWRAHTSLKTSQVEAVLGAPAALIFLGTALRGGELPKRCISGNVELTPAVAQANANLIPGYGPIYAAALQLLGL